jgi:hypothetical protein
MSNFSKEHHDKIQASVSAFRKRSNSMIDFAVANEIEKGNTDVERMSLKFRMTMDNIKNSISKSLFDVRGNTITLKA